MGTSKKQKKREWLRHRGFVLSPYGVIKIKSLSYITPHKLKAALQSGNTAAIAQAQGLFWDRRNWQPLCTQHHNATKQRMEKRGGEIGCDLQGMPLDGNNKYWPR